MKIFVVGGGSGLGSEIVKAAQQAGHVVCYSTSAAHEAKNVIAGCDLRDAGQVERLIGEITTFAPDRLILCPIQTQFKALGSFTSADIAADVAFNISTIIAIAAAYAKSMPAGSVTFLLSHICFLYNPGFTLYKVGKDAIDSFAKAIQFEYPQLRVLRVYPGAMRTNFAASTQYAGLSIFPSKDPALWAARILEKDQGCLIGPVDFLFMILSRAMPFAPQKWFFATLFKLTSSR